MCRLRHCQKRSAGNACCPTRCAFRTVPRYRDCGRQTPGERELARTEWRKPVGATFDSSDAPNMHAYSDSAESRLAMPALGREFCESGSRHWPSLNQSFSLFPPSVFRTRRESITLNSSRGTLLEGRSEIMLSTRSPSLF